MRQIRPLFVGLLVCGAAALPAEARRSHRAAWEPPSTFDHKIAELSKKHNVPERLIHRVIMRESRYNPAAVHAGNYGLMQIRLGTAKTMGYAGSAMGLTDGVTNLTYAVPYLANAYKVAGGDEDRAVRLYASGFYYVAKRQGALGGLQTAGAVAPAPQQVAAYAPAPTNPFAALFGTVTQPAQTAIDAAQAESAANARAMAAAYQTADDVDAPLPPSRPRAYSTKTFIALAMRQDPAAEAPAEPATQPAYAYYSQAQSGAGSSPALAYTQSYEAQAQTTGAAQAIEEEVDAPVPPHRPRAYSTRAFVKLAMQQEERAAAEDLRPAQ